jgi:hypothetical protein
VTFPQIPPYLEQCWTCLLVINVSLPLRNDQTKGPAWMNACCIWKELPIPQNLPPCDDQAIHLLLENNLAEFRPISKNNLLSTYHHYCNATHLISPIQPLVIASSLYNNLTRPNSLLLSSIKRKTISPDRTTE